MGEKESERGPPCSAGAVCQGRSQARGESVFCVHVQHRRDSGHVPDTMTRKAGRAAGGCVCVCVLFLMNVCVAFQGCILPLSPEEQREVVTDSSPFHTELEQQRCNEDLPLAPLFV